MGVNWPSLAIWEIWESKILTRAAILTILLIACAAGLGFKTYRAWQEGPWDLPQLPKGKAVAVAAVPQPAVGPLAQLPIGTEAIVSKNLFDPERGAVKPTQDSDIEIRAVQRVRSMVLLGTAIIGNSRYAIVQEPDGVPPIPGVPGQPRQQPVRRLRVGDNLEGFSVTEIADRRLILTKGATRVEVSVDYFRKVAPPVGGPVLPGAPQPGPVRPGGVQVPQIPTPGATPPGVIPTLPRRPRLPVPPTAPSP